MTERVEQPDSLFRDRTGEWPPAAAGAGDGAGAGPWAPAEPGRGAAGGGAGTQIPPGRSAAGGGPGTQMPRRRDVRERRRRAEQHRPILPPDDDRPEPTREPFGIAGLPAPLRTAIGRRRAAWTRVDTFAFALIGAHLALLLLILPPGSLYLDDLRAQGYAQGQPFFEFIMGSNGTHFAPLPRIIDWVQSRVFPLQHGPGVLVTMLVRLALAIAFWRLLRRTFGPRGPVLVPLTILLITPALLPPTAWLRQSITVVACTVAMVWALDAHLRWVTERRRSDLITVAVATAVGFGFYEKAAVIPVAITGISLAMFVGGRRRRAQSDWPARPIRASFWSALVSSVVVIGFLAIYVTGPYDQGPGTPPSPFDVLTLTWDTVAGTMIPLLLGGPWNWTYIAPYAGSPNIGTPGVVEALIVVGVGLVLALRRNAPQVLRALLFTIAWTIPSVAIITYGRSVGFEAVLGDAVRLWADLVPALLFGAALATLPWRFGAEAEPVQEPTYAGEPVVPPQQPFAPPYGGALPPSALPPGAMSGPTGAHGTSPSGVAIPGGVAAGVVYAPQGHPVTTASYSISSADPAGPGAARPNSPVTRRADRPISIEVTRPALVGLIALAVIVAGSIVSTWRFADQWWDNPTDVWLANARRSLENAEPFPRVVATPLPEAVMPAWVTAEFPTVVPLVLLIRPDARFHDGDGPIRTFDAAGNLVPVLNTRTLGQSKKAAICRAVIPSNGRGVRVPLTNPALYFPGAQLEVGVLLNAPTRVEVMVETSDGELVAPQRWANDDLPQGPHTLLFPVPLNKTVAAVRLLAADQRVSCVNSVRVWVAQP